MPTKDPKLLIPVRCTTRKLYLQKPPPGRNDWHVRFKPPAVDGISKTIFRSTGTKEIAAAKRIAGDIIESFWCDAGRSAEKLKLRNDNATIGELIQRYRAAAVERPDTIRSNIRSLRFVIKVVHRGDPDEKATSVLTALLIRDFERRQLSRVRTKTPVEDRGMLNRAHSSIASYVRQARSIVALKKMKFYEGLKLPDLTAFRGEGVTAPERSMPKPLDMECLAAMEVAVPALAEADPGAYIAHLLFSRLGMRNIEILHARADWIVDGRIGIIRRPAQNFFPKGSEGWVPIAPDVEAEIMRFKSLCVGGYLVPGATYTDRYHAIYRRHSRWVSQWITDHTKTSYELRRYAGSRLLAMGASMLDVRDFLRHRDIQTTQQWYAYRLQNRQLPTIGMRDLLPAELRTQDR